MFEYNDVLTREYKNAEIEIVVEDDAITMGRVYLDKRCVDVREFTTEDGGDVAFNRANFDNVLDQLKGIVDVMWEENAKKLTAVAR